MHAETGRVAPRSLDGNGTVAIVVTLTLLIVASVASERTLYHAGTTARRVVHTYEVLRAVDGLHAALLDAESDRHGLLLSGDRAYVDACAAALARARAGERTLRSLAAEDVEQQHRLDALAPLLAARVAFLREAIDPPNGRVKPAVELPMRDEGKQVLDEVRALLAALRDSAVTHLVEQSQQSAVAGWWLGLTTTSANLLALATAMGGVVLLNRAASRRHATEEALRSRAEADRECECAALHRSRGTLAVALVQSQQAQQSADELVRGIFQAAPVALVALDRAGRVRLWNPAAERAFGWTEPELLGQPYPLVPPGKEAECGELLGRALDGGSLVGIETQQLGKAGVPIDVGISAAPLRGATGQVTGVLVVLVDMTDRKALEAEVHRAQKLETVGRLAGGIAHDFNNLLTVINGCCALLSMRLPPTDPTRELLDELARAGEQAAALTRQLLSVGRRQLPQPRLLDLNAVVANLAKLLRRLIGEDITLATVFDPALGAVHGDRGQLEQVVMNLVLNARDAMLEGGTLTIETRNVADPHLAAHGPCVMLAIRDSGVGMNAATQARIFEPFFTTKEPGHGTGLGLATVYGIVQQSGGSIEVESELGQGTTFKVYLPQVDDRAPVAMPQTAAGEAVLGGTETVLVVEDERMVRGLVCDVMRQRGYTVLEAGDGVAALRVAEGHAGPIHLLITDVVMPRMSGRVLAERLSALRLGLKVLFLSGYADDAVARHGLKDEGAAFLHKPFTPDALARKVREALAAPDP